jgi:hypothetical protein
VVAAWVRPAWSNSSAAAGLADRTTKLPSCWRVHAAALTMTSTPAESSNTTPARSSTM